MHCFQQYAHYFFFFHWFVLDLFTHACNDALKSKIFIYILFFSLVCVRFFSTFNAEIDFYKLYARTIGFDVHLSSAKKLGNILIWRYIVCVQPSCLTIMRLIAKINLKEYFGVIQYQEKITTYIFFMGTLVHCLVITSALLCLIWCIVLL